MNAKKKIQIFKDHDFRLNKGTKGLLIRSNNNIWLNWTNEVGYEITRWELQRMQNP